MIARVFEVLTQAVSGTPAIAILASLGWGVLSVVLSPCHLASIPLIIGFIGEQGMITARRAFALALAFACGVLVTIGIIGGMTAATGRMLGDTGGYTDIIIAVLFFVIGLHFIGIIPIPFSMAASRVTKGRGMPAAFILGLMLGFAVGSCTFAFMAPVLGVTFSVARTNLVYGVALFCAFAIGHGAVIVAAGTFTGAVERYLKWTSQSAGVTNLRRVCGVLLILGGIYMLWA